MELLAKWVPLFNGWTSSDCAIAAVIVVLALLASAALGDSNAGSAAPFPPNLHVNHACPRGVRAASLFYQLFSGCLAASVITVTYVSVPFFVILIPVLMLSQPYWWATWVLAGPFILSAIVPPIPSRAFLQAWPFRHMPKYFNFSEIREISDDRSRSSSGVGRSSSPSNRMVSSPLVAPAQGCSGPRAGGTQSRSRRRSRRRSS